MITNGAGVIVRYSCQVVCVVAVLQLPHVASADDDTDGNSFFIVGSEDLLYRRAQVSNIPNTLSSLTGLGFGLARRRFELSLELRGTASFAKADVTEGMSTQSVDASGLGFDIGARVSIGRLQAEGVYYSLWVFPRYSHWNLKGTLEGNSSFDASVHEVATEFGASLTTTLSERVIIGVNVGVARVGVRPSSDEILSGALYPSIGFYVKYSLFGRAFEE